MKDVAIISAIWFIFFDVSCNLFFMNSRLKKSHAKKNTEAKNRWCVSKAVMEKI